MYTTCISICLSVVLFYTVTASIPTWLRPCSRKDPKFGACAVESAAYAIPRLIDGDKKYGIPSLRPFKITRINLLGQESLKLKLHDVEIYGLENLNVYDIKTDFEKQEVSMKTWSPYLDLRAQYDIDGRILFIPLQGKGPCKLELIGGNFSYYFPYDLKTRKGKVYGEINDAKSTFDYEFKNITFALENLFNGNELLGNETNKLLNENWREINKDIKGPITELNLAIFSEMARKVFGRVPYDELFSS